MKRLVLSLATLLTLTAAASAQSAHPDVISAFFGNIVNGTEQMVSGAVVVVTSPFEFVRPIVAPPPPRRLHRR